MEVSHPLSRILLFIIPLLPIFAQTHLCVQEIRADPPLNIAWSVTTDLTQIYFTIEVDVTTAQNWVGIGWSPDGLMTGASSVLYTPADGLVQEADLDKLAYPSYTLEDSQDLTDVVVEQDTTAWIHFTRDVDPGDGSYVIDLDADTPTLAAIGYGPGPTLNAHLTRWPNIPVHYGAASCILDEPTAAPVDPTEPVTEPATDPATELGTVAATEAPIQCGDAPDDLFDGISAGQCDGYHSGEDCIDWTCLDSQLTAHGSPLCGEDGMWTQDDANCLPAACIVGSPQVVGDGYCDWDSTLQGDLEYNSGECRWDFGDCCASTCEGDSCGSNGFHCLDPNAEDRDCIEFQYGPPDHKNAGTIILDFDFDSELEEDCEAICCGQDDCVSYNWYEIDNLCELLSDVTSSDPSAGWVSGDFLDCPQDLVWKIGDGYCDYIEFPLANTAECAFDGGDCCAATCMNSVNYTCGPFYDEESIFACDDPDQQDDCSSATPTEVNDGFCDWQLNNEGCNWDGGDCCEHSCMDGTSLCGTNGYRCFDPAHEDECNVIFPHWLGDDFCDAWTVDIAFNTELCEWDGGDCCEETCSGTSLKWTCGVDSEYHCLDPEFTDFCQAVWDDPWIGYHLVDFACYDGYHYESFFEAQQKCCECPTGCGGVLTELNGKFTIRNGTELRQANPPREEIVHRMNPRQQSSCEFQAPIPNAFMAGYACNNDGRKYHTEMDALEKCCTCDDCNGITCEEDGTCTVRKGREHPLTGVVYTQKSPPVHGETTIPKVQPDPECTFTTLQNAYLPDNACDGTEYLTIGDAQRGCCGCPDCAGVTENTQKGVFTTRLGPTPRGSRTNEITYMVTG